MKYNFPTSQAGIFVLEEIPTIGIVRAAGNAKPADNALGYAPGCLFSHLDGVDGDQLYINVGTKAAADFDSFTGGVDLSELTASIAELNITDGITATAAEINAAADLSANTVVVAVGGSTVTPLVGGGTYLIPLVTANVTMTLPAATLGEKHRLCFIGSAADAEDWVITSPTLLVGGFSHFDVGGTSAAAYANGTTHTIVTVNNPAAGTDITFIGDGTNWACTGQVSSADIHAFS